MSTVNNLLFQSIHIPKTAGTTFWFVLMDMGISPPDILLDNVYLRQKYPKVEQYHKIIHGHFPHWRWDYKFPNLQRVSWIRHPAERLMSHYLFWEKNANEESIDYAMKVKTGEVTLENFIEDMSNYMTNYFIPLDRLDEYVFIGLFEELNKSFQKFFDMFNNGEWVEPGHKYENKERTEDHYDIPLSIRRKIERCNIIDYKLYHLIEERWLSG